MWDWELPKSKSSVKLIKIPVAEVDDARNVSSPGPFFAVDVEFNTNSVSPG